MTIKQLYKVFASHPEGRWIMIPQNAQLLYQFVRKHPIKNILDLGTGIGCAAAIAALALKDKGETEGRITSLEQYEKCVKIANELIPQELRETINVIHSPMAVWQTEHIPYQYFSVYSSIPEGDYDLIVNDGPAPFAENGHYVELQNATVTKLLLENKLKPGAFVAWDGRISALKTLEQYFGDNFYLVQPGGQSDFNVLERKDNPVAFRDTKMEAMQESGYFTEAV